MESNVTQAEIEWLRCLTVSKKFMPILPEDVQRKLVSARLVEAKAGRSVVTPSGSALLQRR